MELIYRDGATTQSPVPAQAAADHHQQGSAGGEAIRRHENISSGGVLFTSETEAELGVSVEIVISLSGSLQEIVNLRCSGNIVRCNQTASGEQSRYDIAAALRRYEFVRE